MSEDDRAAKAARAKALLKKRQQKKAGGIGATSPGLASPVSRPFSPALSEVPALAEEEKSDIGDVFVKADSDNDCSWLRSLPRADGSPSSVVVPSPPAQTQSPLARDASVVVPPPQIPSPSADVVDGFQAEIQRQKQNISTLVSEKADLAAALEKLRGIEARAKEQYHLLEDERVNSRQLTSKLDNQRKAAFMMASEKETLVTSLKQLEDVESERQKALHLLQEERKKSDELNYELQNQQRAISLLVSEKASLTASVERLEDLESETREKDGLLQDEQTKSRILESQLQQLQADMREASIRLQQLDSREKELTERCREQERELQLSNGTIDGLREEVTQHQQRVRELEEQIQSDDRIERLEGSLKNTQDRADELEFQLSKTKQAHNSLKLERDNFELQLNSSIEAVAGWENKHADLHKQHTSTLEELASTATTRDTLLHEKSSIQAQMALDQSALQELQQQLADAVSALTTAGRQLQDARTDARNANRRAEEAEKTQKDLQAEGTTLMRSLDEMRPKIVELTDIKLDLVEKIEDLEKAIRQRETTISQLESSVDDIRAQKSETDRQLQELVHSHEKEHSLTLDTSMEMQKAYSRLQAELDNTSASIQTLEIERANHRQLTMRQSEEIEHLTLSARTQAEELTNLREELECRGRVEEEERGFIERAQNEIESLRAELSSKEDELQRLQESAPTSPSVHESSRSLDDEMLSALRQQHALDLSSASSQIRALETSVFEAEARAHSLQKQVRSLEDQLIQIRTPFIPRPFSPSIPSRPSSRALNHSDLRRASFGSHKTNNQAPPLSRSAFDRNLSPETRHKRQVSLSMLKARIDSEVAAAALGSRPGSRAISPALGTPTKNDSGALSTVQEPPRSSPLLAGYSHSLTRPQFLDDSHIFWCHSCQGDLVIL